MVGWGGEEETTKVVEEESSSKAVTETDSSTEVETFTIADLSLWMLWLRPGTFEMTQAQRQEVMGNNPSYSKGANLPVEKVI